VPRCVCVFCLLFDLIEQTATVQSKEREREREESIVFMLIRIYSFHDRGSRKNLIKSIASRKIFVEYIVFVFFVLHCVLFFFYNQTTHPPTSSSSQWKCQHKYTQNRGQRNATVILLTLQRAEFQNSRLPHFSPASGFPMSCSCSHW